MDNEALLIDWLTLWQAKCLSRHSILTLLEHFPNPHAIINADKKTLQRCGLKTKAIQSLHHPNKKLIDQALHWNESKQHAIVTLTNGLYPLQLAHTPDPPLLFFVKGDPSILHTTQLAIVGSRNPSPIGRELALQFAYELSKAGLIITSGLAIGIDGAAHQGTLNAKGKTIAVLGNGLNRLYPAAHRNLATRLLNKGGCLVSEFPLDDQPRRPYFPLRNRIISGLSKGTLVVEATIKSGSLITAHQALEQGREVFAMPGSLKNPQSTGCHHLIQQGAMLVKDSNDILQELGMLAKSSPKGSSKSTPKKAPKQGQLRLEEPYINLLDCVGYEATSLDHVTERAKLAPSQVSSMLVTLEISGHIIRVPGGVIRAIP